MATRTSHNQSMISTLTRAIELTEDALEQIARMAVEGIHGGLDAGSHVEAGERHMRSALRQLGLAERELCSQLELPTDLGARPGPIANVVSGPGSQTSASGT